MLKEAVGIYHKPYFLQRNQAERNINDYNPALLMAHEGNIDVQYCADASSTNRTCAYVAGYASKGEKGTLDLAGR